MINLQNDERIPSMSFISVCTSEVISQAAKALKDGHLVAFPTETVYGLGADATNSEAVARIYSVKGRPADHPLIVHIAAKEDMGQWASEIPEYAIKLAREFWPGPMTLVLKRSDLAKDFITGGQDTVGVRVPNQPIALALLEEFKKLGGKGVAAPSANRFGAVSPTTADAVLDELSDFLSNQDLILDGGNSQVGIESTIIDCTTNDPRVLRPGAITQEMIESISGLEVVDFDGIVDIRVSGSLESHYSPKAKVVNNVKPLPGDGFIALVSTPTPVDVIRLASPKNIEEFASMLYYALRLGDHEGLETIVVQLPSGIGLAEAIRDRVERATKK
jgi:L-threonylcarbamoyladenylate synthase